MLHIPYHLYQKSYLFLLSHSHIIISQYKEKPQMIIAWRQETGLRNPGASPQCFSPQSGSDSQPA